MGRALQPPFRSFIVKMVTSSASREQLARRMGRQCIVNAVIFSGLSVEFFVLPARIVGGLGHWAGAIFIALSVSSLVVSITWFRRAKAAQAQPSP